MFVAPTRNAVTVTVTVVTSAQLGLHNSESGVLPSYSLWLTSLRRAYCHDFTKFLPCYLLSNLLLCDFWLLCRFSLSFPGAKKRRRSVRVFILTWPYFSFSFLPFSPWLLLERRPEERQIQRKYRDGSRTHDCFVSTSFFKVCTWSLDSLSGWQRGKTEGFAYGLWFWLENAKWISSSQHEVPFLEGQTLDLFLSLRKPKAILQNWSL